MKYLEWILDDHTLDIRFEDEAVVINQQEQEVDSWRIFPLSHPAQVHVCHNGKISRQRVSAQLRSSAFLKTGLCMIADCSHCTYKT